MLRQPWKYLRQSHFSRQVPAWLQPTPRHFHAFSAAFSKGTPQDAAQKQRSIPTAGAASSEEVTKASAGAASDAFAPQYEKTMASEMLSQYRQRVEEELRGAWDSNDVEGTIAILLRHETTQPLPQPMLSEWLTTVITKAPPSDFPLVERAIDIALHNLDTFSLPQLTQITTHLASLKQWATLVDVLATMEKDRSTYAFWMKAFVPTVPSIIIPRRVADIKDYTGKRKKAPALDESEADVTAYNPLLPRERGSSAKPAAAATGHSKLTLSRPAVTDTEVEYLKYIADAVETGKLLTSPASKPLLIGLLYRLAEAKKLQRVADIVIARAKNRSGAGLRLAMKMFSLAGADRLAMTVADRLSVEVSRNWSTSLLQNEFQQYVFSRATKLRDAQRHTEALELLYKALAVDVPEKSKCYSFIIATYIESGAVERALLSASEALEELGEDAVSAAIAGGAACTKRGDYSNAISFFKLVPPSAIPTNALARLLIAVENDGFTSLAVEVKRLIHRGNHSIRPSEETLLQDRIGPAAVKGLRSEMFPSKRYGLPALTTLRKLVAAGKANEKDYHDAIKELLTASKDSMKRDEWYSQLVNEAAWQLLRNMKRAHLPVLDATLRTFIHNAIDLRLSATCLERLMELDCLNFSVDQEHNVGVYNDVLRLAAAAATPTANHDNSLPLQVAYETIMAFTEQGLPPKRATFAALLALALRMDPSFQVLNSLVNFVKEAFSPPDGIQILQYLVVNLIDFDDKGELLLPVISWLAKEHGVGPTPLLHSFFFDWLREQDSYNALQYIKFAIAEASYSLRATHVVLVATSARESNPPNVGHLMELIDMCRKNNIQVPAAVLSLFLEAIAGSAPSDITPDMKEMAYEECHRLLRLPSFHALRTVIRASLYFEDDDLASKAMKKAFILLDQVEDSTRGGEVRNAPTTRSAEAALHDPQGPWLPVLAGDVRFTLAQSVTAARPPPTESLDSVNQELNQALSSLARLAAGQQCDTVQFKELPKASVFPQKSLPSTEDKQEKRPITIADCANSFVYHYIRKGQFERAATVLEELKDRGVEGDEWTALASEKLAQEGFQNLV